MLFILIGCAAKSAQLGLHNWLLSSMEGLVGLSLISIKS
jgi:NADH:ubiquinone oxidoreductase subunit 5 (subunit L)/multisubunit Na+/H+ antiporter MnhA subunit